MNLKIKLKANFAKDKKPSIKISVNNAVLYNGLVDYNEKEYSFDVEPIQQNQLTIEHYNKQNNDTIADENGNIVAETWQAIAGNQPQQSGLARTVQAEDPYFGAWKKRQRYVFQNLFFWGDNFSNAVHGVNVLRQDMSPLKDGCKDGECIHPQGL